MMNKFTKSKTMNLEATNIEPNTRGYKCHNFGVSNV